MYEPLGRCETVVIPGRAVYSAYATSSTGGCQGFRSEENWWESLGRGPGRVGRSSSRSFGCCRALGRAPRRGSAVVWEGESAGGDMGDKGPGVPAVGAGIEVDVRAVQECGDGVAG